MVSGDGQSSVPNTALSPFTARVTDSLGNPAPSVTVTWNVTTVPSGAANQTFNGSLEKIAYTSNRDGVDEIWVINVDGTGNTRLTTTTSANRNPTWSPDGTQIAFSSDRNGNAKQIFRMNADGSNQVYTGATGDHPKWSPDGAKFVAIDQRTGDTYPKVYVQNIDGTSPVAVYSVPGGASLYHDLPSSAVWGPDGLVYYATKRTDATGFITTYSVSASGAGTSTIGNLDLYTRGPNGASAGIVHTGSLVPKDDALVVNGTTLVNFLHGMSAASFSPDGARLTFSVGQSVTTTPSTTQDVFLINADGSAYTRLTLDGSANRDPEWSPVPASASTSTSNTTDANGLATATFIVGNAAGSYVVTATCSACTGTSGTTFTATVTSATPTPTSGSTSQSQLIPVNTTVDAPDTNPGDGVCRTATNTCSLRAAIQEAATVTSGTPTSPCRPAPTPSPACSPSPRR